MVIAWSKVFKISQSFIKMFLCFIKLPNFEISIFIFLICFFKKMAASLAQGEAPCDLELAMGKYIYIYIYIYIAIYTNIFMHMAMGGIYRLWKKYTHCYLLFE